MLDIAGSGIVTPASTQCSINGDLHSAAFWPMRKQCHHHPANEKVNTYKQMFSIHILAILSQGDMGPIFAGSKDLAAL